MTDNEDSPPEGIHVTYTASVVWEPWEVEEFGITEQNAIENLADGIMREPGNYGEYEVERVPAE